MSCLRMASARAQSFSLAGLGAFVNELLDFF